MKGQTLIEVLVALAIAALVVSAITVISISSLSNAQYVKNQDTASKYAQEGMEIMRRIRNSNYADFKLYSGVYCLGSGETTLAAAVGSCTTKNLDDTFIRSVDINQDDLINCGGNLARVTVNVSYTSGKCRVGTFCHSSKMISCFSTVNPVVGP